MVVSTHLSFIVTGPKGALKTELNNIFSKNLGIQISPKIN